MNISAGNRLSCRIPADRLWLITNGLWALSFVARLSPPLCLASDSLSSAF